MRFGEPLPERHREPLRQRLRDDLARVTWPGGEPVFRVRDPRPRESRDGGDLVVVVRRAGAAHEVLVDGEPDSAPVVHLGRISGTHHRRTAGILLAAGPDVASGADVEGIGIHDLAPTVLYALGLPVGEDFAGEARTGLFTSSFRGGRAVTTVATWGTRTAEEAPRSQSDRELLDELGALGYLR